MGGQSGRPWEAKVRGHGRLKWEAVRGQIGRPWEVKVGGRSGRLKWEAEVGGHVRGNVRGHVRGQIEKP